MTLLSPPPRTEYQPKHALEPERRRRFEQANTLFVLFVLIITAGFVAGTTATFTSSVSESASRFAMASLNRPSNLNATVGGNNITLGWLGVSGDNNANAGYNILWADPGATGPTGASPTCTGLTDANYTKVGDTLATSFVHDASSVPAGRYVCYKAQTVYPYPPSANPWTSQGNNPDRDVQAGFVASNVILGNGGTAFSFASGDTITITFNQPVDSTTGPAAGTTPSTGSHPRICTYPLNGSEVVLVGAMGGPAAYCNPSETTIVGRLTPPSDRINVNIRYNVTWAWQDCNGNACKVLKATLGSIVYPAPPPPVSPANTGAHAPWTFTPSAGMLSATGSLPICTTNPVGGLCEPQTGGGW